MAVALTACDDYNDNFEGLDDIVNESQSNVISGVTYELTESDYSTIGGYTGESDEETALLKSVKTNKAFPSDDLAHKYLPKFVSSKWYTADKSSAVTISYNVTGDSPAYITKLANATTYELTSDDYAKVWGSAKAGYLTKSTVSNIPSILSSAVTGAESGDYALVSYEYSESEPSSSSDDDTPVCNWSKLSGGEYPTGSSWSYVQSGKIDLSAYAGQTVRLAFRYQSTSSLAGTVEVKNLNVADASVTNYVTPVLFAAQSDGSYAKVSYLSGAGKYLVLAEKEGQYYAFGKIKDGKAYGYSVSDPVTVTDDVVSATDAASLFIELEASSNGYYLKNADGTYLYMKGTYDSFNTASAVGDEGYDWTVSVSSGSVDIVNVLTGKSVRYDTKYSSYGSYAGSKLGVYLSNSLLSSELPEGFVIKDVNLPSAATYIWQMTSNYGAKASAYINKTNYESESWLVTSEIDLSSATSPYVSVDWAGNYFSGNDVEDYLGIYVSTDYEDGADFNVDGTKALKANVATDSKLAIYTYDGSAWSIPSSILVVNPSDYKAMGISSNSFSSSNKPATYLPAFFKTNLPYALEGAQAAAVYYYGSTLEAVEYTYTDGAWATSATYTTSTGQFIKSSDGWMYDPCVTLNLPYDRSDATAKEFYQMVTDWVWENIDRKQNGCENKGEGYVTSYGNNEYYTGSSAYYNNVDWRASKATAQTSAYDGMTDEQVFEQMQQNLIDTYGKVLALKYPEAKPIDGVDVIYTINFVAYYSKENNGSNAGVSYTIQYKVTDVATFEYVEGSLKEVE